MGTGQADAFLKGFVEDFKPAFEQKYAISSNNSACTIMGADVAGLFAFYATIKHPHLFGRCVMFSPAFWYNKKELRDFIGQLTPTYTSTYFLFVETSADSNWITDEITYYENWINNNVSFAHVYKIEGEHDDRTWGTMFATTLFDIPIELPTTEAAISNKQSITDYIANTWYFMKGEGTTSLTCEGTPTQKGSFYKRQGLYKPYDSISSLQSCKRGWYYT